MATQKVGTGLRRRSTSVPGSSSNALQESVHAATPRREDAYTLVPFSRPVEYLLNFKIPHLFKIFFYLFVLNQKFYLVHRLATLQKSLAYKSLEKDEVTAFEKNYT